MQTNSFPKQSLANAGNNFMQFVKCFLIKTGVLHLCPYIFFKIAYQVQEKWYDLINERKVYYSRASNTFDTIENQESAHKQKIQVMHFVYVTIKICKQHTKDYKPTSSIGTQSLTLLYCIHLVIPLYIQSCNFNFILSG